MTLKILLPVLESTQFRVAPGNLHILKVRASDLVKIQDVLPLTPNVRRASKNRVTEGIVKDIEQDPFMLMLAPIQLTAKSATKLRLSSGRDAVEMEMLQPDESTGFKGHGGIDGGHRLKALRDAKSAGLELDNVTCILFVSTGLDEKRMADRAIKLNTSKNPSKSSLLDYSGTFDWIREALPSSDFKIQYYSEEENTYSDSFCKPSGVVFLCELLNPRYDPANAEERERYPFRVCRPSAPDFVRYIDPAIEISREGSLLQDFLFIQEKICRAIESSHNRSSFPFVKTPEKIKNATHLPSGAVLSCKIPSRAMTYPAFSAFRFWMNDSGDGWKYPVEFFAEELALKLIAKYKEIIKKSSVIDVEKINADPQTFSDLYQVSRKHLEAFEAKPRNAKLRLAS